VKRWQFKTCTYLLPPFFVPLLLDPRYRCLSVASGSVTMGAGVSSQPEQLRDTGSIVYFIPSCVNKKSYNFNIYN
jgi:hypothetical protein